MDHSLIFCLSGFDIWRSDTLPDPGFLVSFAGISKFGIDTGINLARSIQRSRWEAALNPV